jgi:site-specific DNA-methyltransferase (adenine-specific)
MTWLVKLVAPKGSVILDPYFGSGTTGLAALEADCTFIGIERDPVFHGVAESRLAGMADTLESRADDRRAREVFALMQELEQE